MCYFLVYSKVIQIYIYIYIYIHTHIQPLIYIALFHNGFLVYVVFSMFG